RWQNAAEKGIEAERRAQIMAEIMQSGTDYIRLCAEAYDRHFAERPWWKRPSEPTALSLPEPENAVQWQALQTYLGVLQTETGARPRIDFEGCPMPEGSVASPASEGPADRLNSKGQAAQEEPTTDPLPSAAGRFIDEIGERLGALITYLSDL